MNETQAIDWKKTRERGLVRWILVRWTLGLSLPLSAGILLPGLVKDPESRVQTLLLHLPLCAAVGGIVAGLATWYLFEDQYRRYIARVAGPVAPGPDKSQST